MNTKKLNSVKKVTKIRPESNGKTKTSANEPSILIMVTFASMLKNIVRTIFIIPIKFYKWAISPLLPMACRHVPTCSEYAMEAIMVHGIFKGSWLAARRIARCHPWGTHGYDPVPKKKVEVKKLKMN